MVSCRTVQGRKGVEKDKRNQRRTELVRAPQASADKKRVQEDKKFNV
jgi:hypothetical protein